MKYFAISILIVIFGCLGLQTPNNPPVIKGQGIKVLLKDGTLIPTTHLITTVDNVFFAVEVEDPDVDAKLWLLEMRNHFDNSIIFKQTIPIDQYKTSQTFQTEHTFQIPRDLTGYFNLISTVIDSNKNRDIKSLTLEVFCNRREQLDPDLKCPMTYSDVAIKYWEKGLPPFN